MRSLLDPTSDLRILDDDSSSVGARNDHSVSLPRKIAVPESTMHPRKNDSSFVHVNGVLVFGFLLLCATHFQRR